MTCENRLNLVSSHSVTDEKLISFRPYNYEHRIVNPVTNSNVILGSPQSVSFDLNLNTDSMASNSVLCDMYLRGTVTNNDATHNLYLPFSSLLSMLQRIILRKRGQILIDYSDNVILRTLLCSNVLNYISFSRFARDNIGSCQSITDPTQHTAVNALSSKEFYVSLNMLIHDLLKNLPLSIVGNLNIELQFMQNADDYTNSQYFSYDAGLVLSNVTISNLTMVLPINHFTCSQQKFNTYTKRFPHLQVYKQAMVAPASSKVYRTDLNLNFSPVTSCCRVYYWSLNNALGNGITTVNNCQLFFNTGVTASEFLINNVRQYLCNTDELFQLMNDLDGRNEKAESILNSPNAYMQSNAPSLFTPLDLQYVDRDMRALSGFVHPISSVDNLSTSNLISINTTVTTPNLATAFSAGSFLYVLESNRLFTFGENDTFSIST
jgi:hypothetical protein